MTMTPKAPKYILTEEIEAKLAMIEKVADDLITVEARINASLQAFDERLLAMSNRIDQLAAAEQARYATIKDILESE